MSFKFNLSPYEVKNSWFPLLAYTNFCKQLNALNTEITFLIVLYVYMWRKVFLDFFSFVKK